MKRRNNADRYPSRDVYLEQVRKAAQHLVKDRYLLTEDLERLVDQFEPGEAPAYLVENQTGSVAVLNGGGMDNDPHGQPFAVDQGVDIAALDLLAGVIA